MDVECHANGIIVLALGLGGDIPVIIGLVHETCARSALAIYILHYPSVHLRPAPLPPRNKFPGRKD